MVAPRLKLTFWIAAAWLICGAAHAGVRIKDITEWSGARSNQLIGFGLVAGLDNTGSRSLFTQQVAVDMLQRFKVASKILPEARGENVFRSGNIAAVMVTASLGPFARRGSQIDATVSILDDSTSLQGGLLLLTPLKGADGVDYAVAQGPISVGGFSYSTPSAGGQAPAASARKNHTTVGRIPGGATVEIEVPGNILCQGQLQLVLLDPDPVTARGITFAINERFPDCAVTVDAGTVRVFVPQRPGLDVVAFAGEIGLLEMVPDTIARVVINERTGTVVSGEQVKISAVAIAHGNLAIMTNQDIIISQPAPFSNGNTVVAPQQRLDVAEQLGVMKAVDRSVTVAEVARALNSLGVTPRDLIAIFQALKQAGALHAELVIM